MHLPWRQCKVDNGDLCGDLWCVVRVRKLCSDVKLEVIMVRDNGISEFDHCAT